MGPESVGSGHGAPVAAGAGGGHSGDEAARGGAAWGGILATARGQEAAAHVGWYFGNVLEPRAIALPAHGNHPMRPFASHSDRRDIRKTACLRLSST